MFSPNHFFLPSASVDREVNTVRVSGGGGAAQSQTNSQPPSEPTLQFNWKALLPEIKPVNPSSKMHLY